MIETEFFPEKLHLQEQWCSDRQITLKFNQLGKPMQNGYFERSNGSIRRELLNGYLIYSLAEVRGMIMQPPISKRAF